MLNIYIYIYNGNSLNNLINNKTLIYDDENFIRQAKVDTIYPITTIRKANNEGNAINILYFGNKFDANVNEFNKFVYNDRVNPLFMGDPNDQSVIKDNPIFPIFQTNISNHINAYSITPPDPEPVNNTNGWWFGFFGQYSEYISGLPILVLKDKGYVKSSVLLNDFINNFGGYNTFSEMGDICIIDNSYSSVAASGYFFKPNLTTKYHNYKTAIHEFSHTFSALADEYTLSGYQMTYGPNVSRTSDVSWKEFLGFRGVGIYEISTNRYIPTNKQCIMFSNSYRGYCEVCSHHIAKTFNERLGLNYLYIADPQLTIEHEPYTSNIYDTNYLSKLEVFDENLHTANNKKLEFRTVVDNWTTETKEIKMQIKITSSDGTQKFIEEKDFEIQPNQLKGLFLETKPITNIVEGDKITAHIIDLKTNKVLATHEQRENSVAKKNLISSDDTSISNPIKNLYPVKINYKIKGTNNDIPNTFPFSTLQRKGEIFKINKVLFNGYKFDSSSVPEMEITISENNPEITLYYEQLPFKTLKLNLLDDLKQVVLKKELKIYEGQVFIPRETDFFLYNLETFHDGGIDNNKWINRAEPPISIYEYDQIQDGMEINYNIKESYSNIINSKNRMIMQGDNYVDFLDEKGRNSYMTKYNYSVLYNERPKISYNNVDINTPGKYKITYYSEEYNENTQKYYKTNKDVEITVIPNNDLSWSPDWLLSEYNRLNSITFLSNLETINESNYNAIDNSNLINYISNGLFNKNKFKYNINITKKSSNWVYFDIDIVYNNQIKTINSKNMYFNVVSDEAGSIDELEQEIIRVNSLNLLLKKIEYTQEEISKINASNILQNLNNWIENSKFLYEVIEFSNINNSFKFKIKISEKNNSNKEGNSKEFLLSYKIIETFNNIELEKIRIDNLLSNSTLIKNVFSQSEINSLSKLNISSYISNWSQIIINNNEYNYEIIDFTKENNEIKFKIKIISKNDLSLYLESNFFSSNYIISDSISEELNAEKNRIDGLNLSLNKTNFSQSEFDELIKNNSLITKYLNNWIPNNNFTYNFLVEQINNKLQVIITIQKIDNPSNSINANPILVDYEIISNASNNNLMIILLSTLIPVLGLIIVAILLVVKFKRRNKRNY